MVSKYYYSSCKLFFPAAAKLTIDRLNSTPLQRQVREQKIASAVRTILECIGEDPDREGLLRTPERFAQSVMWMTRGYEERLAGRCDYLKSKQTHLLTFRNRCH